MKNPIKTYRQYRELHKVERAPEPVFAPEETTDQRQPGPSTKRKAAGELPAYLTCKRNYLANTSRRPRRNRRPAKLKAAGLEYNPIPMLKALGYRGRAFYRAISGRSVNIVSSAGTPLPGGRWNVYWSMMRLRLYGPTHRTARK